WWQVILTERLGTALLLLGPLALLALGTRLRALPWLAVLAGLGGAAAAIVQHKGWPYHAIPVRFFGGLAALVLGARWLDRALPAARAAAAAPGVAFIAAWAALLLAVTGAEAPWREITWHWSPGGRIAALLRHEAEGQRVLFLSPWIYPGYPGLNYAEANSTLPTMNVWLLQSAYAQDCAAGGATYRAPAEMAPPEAFLWRRVTRDFARDPPAAILVAIDPRIADCGRGFDLIAYFRRDPGFEAAFHRFREVATVDGYRLYRRAD
ncbi:MAG TPA: hypothetical protein VE684_15475, partial [Crenalkalicoccus sp.]|nr:hypothetical protein [Crenalkalicoccus sp.]